MGSNGAAPLVPPLRTRPDDLRTNLRLAFEAHDGSGSGRLSLSLIESVLAAANVDISPEDAFRFTSHPAFDHTESITFEELFSRIKHGIQSNRRSHKSESAQPEEGLASLWINAPSFFTWINPLAWISARDDTSEISQALNPTRSATPVRSKRSVHSEWVVRERNAQLADVQRDISHRNVAWRKEQEEWYLERRRRRRSEFRQQRRDVVEACEALQSVKRETGVQMRQKLQMDYQKVQEDKRERAKLVSAVTIEARQVKAAATSARNAEKERTAQLIAIQAQADRARHKEESLQTVRAQEKAKKEYAAQVRYETRPAVRQRTRDFYQASRDAMYRAEKIREEENRAIREAQLEEFLSGASERVLDVKVAELISAPEARRRLEEKRWQDADEVRYQLYWEGERKRQEQERVARELQEKYETVRRDRFDPLGEDDWIKEGQEREMLEIAEMGLDLRDAQGYLKEPSAYLVAERKLAQEQGWLAA